MFAGLAAGYASARPPVHAHIIRRLAGYLPARTASQLKAADIGCGAGLSTRALEPVAAHRIGFEPAAPMLRFASSVDPAAHFAAAAAEAIPLCDGSVDLLSAAGSLNYVTDLERTFAELRRVLAPDGVLAVYDFSQGAGSADTCELATWFQSFRVRYPAPKGHARTLNPEILASVASGFRLDYQESFEVNVPMAVDAYLAYIMTETNVAAAIEAGEAESEARSWCGEGLRRVFADRTLHVQFPAYLACLLPANK